MTILADDLIIDCSTGKKYQHEKTPEEKEKRYREIKKAKEDIEEKEKKIKEKKDVLKRLEKEAETNPVIADLLLVFLP